MEEQNLVPVEPVQLMQVDASEIMSVQSRAEIDMQISTAHAYPRNITTALKNIEMVASMDEEVAGSCFYVLRRGNQTIKGLSVRMAEIVASQWGNLRIDARIVANDGKTVTAQCTAHDLETNVAIRKEVKRRITDKNGRTFNEDMQVVTGNAAMAIAFRNAVNQIIPQAVIKKIVDKVDNIANGKAMSLETSRANAVATCAKWGITEDVLLKHFEIDNIERMDQDMLKILRGEMTAIKEGTTTVHDTFIKPIEEEKAAAEKEKELSKASAAAQAAAMAAAGKTFSNNK